jgi:hypothetical protein
MDAQWINILHITNLKKEKYLKSGIEADPIVVEARTGAAE